MSATLGNHSRARDPVEVRAEMERIAASRFFRQAEGLSRFLRHIVEETLAGRGNAIKEYSIGVAVFGRGASFDPKADTIVRVQARRLRARLAEYYRNSAAGAVIIELPKGAYVPVFTPGPKRADEHPGTLSAPKGVDARRLSGRRIIIAGICGVALVAAAGSLVRRAGSDPRDHIFEAIAVLPFESLSTGADQGYLADGLTEALITNLGQASPLRVIARTSVNKYRGTTKSVGEIARELHVDAVVEGTVTHSGDRLRVTANLIQVNPETHLWARSYERSFGDVLALQAELAGAIAAGIHVSLTPKQQARLESNRPVKPDAQLAYWKALYFLQGRRDRESALKSVEYAEQAVGADPDYAPAQAALARSYLMLSNLGGALPADIIAGARSAAEKAIVLDEDLSEAHVALGSILLAYDWNWSGAEREARLAIRLNPSSADARLLLANYLAAVGRVEEAVVEIKRARELDPFSFYINRNVGRLLYFARKYDEALTELRQAADMQPDSAAVVNWIAMTYLKIGKTDEGFRADLRDRAVFYRLDTTQLSALQSEYSSRGLPGYWRKLRELLPDKLAHEPHTSYHLAEIGAFLGDRDDAFRWLEQAFAERTGHMPWIKVTPSLDSLRSDVRFTALLRRMGLAS